MLRKKNLPVFMSGIVIIEPTICNEEPDYAYIYMECIFRFV
jgi:hypothetical protein